MKQVDQISEVRLSLSRGESMRSIAKRCRMSRNTVKKIASSGLTEFVYKAREPVFPALGPFMKRLEELLAGEEGKPGKERRTAQQIYEELQLEGYSGSYDTVRRYAKNRKEECNALHMRPVSDRLGSFFHYPRVANKCIPRACNPTGTSSYRPCRFLSRHAICKGKHHSLKDP